MSLLVRRTEEMKRGTTMRILCYRIECVNLCWATSLGTAFPLSADLSFHEKEKRQTNGGGKSVAYYF